MGLFSFFKKNKAVKFEHPIPILQVGTDIHAHFLPGLDDGAATMENSVEMIREMVNLGYTKLICTPHVMFGHFQNSTATILSGLESLKKRVAEENIKVEIAASAEYNFDQEFIRRIDQDDLLTFGNENYRFLLFELSYFNEPMGIAEVIGKIKEKGIAPILAHPERYPYFAEQKHKYQQLKDLGVLFQININSLSGLYPGGAAATAAWLIDQEMVEFIGSDAHRIDHVHLLKESFRWEKLHQLVNSGKLMNPYIE